MLLVEQKQQELSCFLYFRAPFIAPPGMLSLVARHGRKGIVGKLAEDCGERLWSLSV